MDRPALIPALVYKNPEAALDWLGVAFGFEHDMVIRDADGKLAHAEMRLGDGYVMVAAEWADFTASPASIGGKNTQYIHLQLRDDVDAHCARARAAGAAIVMEPEEQFYGDRTYRARDLEGHAWTFAQTVRRVSRNEAEAASGLKIEGWG